MANFAVAAHEDTIEFSNKVMDMYAHDGEKKEDTLRRIMQTAETQYTKGTHEYLHASLNAVDATLSTLIKQINGIVSGQDNQLADYKLKLENAIKDKRAALEAAKEQSDAAAAKSKLADESLQKAADDINLAKSQALESIKKANAERDQALRERDDARVISDEKTASNELLMRQMATLEADATAYKDLQGKYTKLQADHSSLAEKAKDDANRAAAELKDARRDTADAEKEIARLQDSLSALQNAHDKLSEENKDLQNQVSRKEQEAIKAAGEAELAMEKAVIAKEREMQDLIRQADKENARLSALVEQLKAQINDLTKQAANE